MNKFVTSLLLVMGFLSAVNAAAESIGDPEAGKEKSSTCAACHGADGNSAVGNFPKLAGQGEQYLLKQMIDVKEGNREIVEMTGMLDGFNEQDLKDIAAYFSAQDTTVGQADPDLIAEGEKLYKAGNPATNIAACMGCHGPAGGGIELAVFPKLAGQHAEYTAKQLKMFRSGERANDGESQIMRSVAARLRDREIEALASYISGLYE